MAEAKIATPLAGAISTDFVDSGVTSFLASPKNILARNAVTKNDVLSVIMDRDAFKRNSSFAFSTKLSKEGKATSQKSSGRCWLFAAMNVMRLPTMEKYSLANDFEFSQSYLFFFDKLEKSNYFLENILDTLEEPVDGRLVQYLLVDPICDGGQWDMVINLVEKYGLVPKDVYPESFSSSNSRQMRWLMTNKLREFAKTLRNESAAGKSLEELREIKSGMLAELFNILCIHLGEPPKQFDWTYVTKDGEHNVVPSLTPQTFYSEYIPYDISTKISLLNDPRNEYGKLYTVSRLGNVTGGNPIRYINLPAADLRAATKAELDNQRAVWFGCDVGKRFNRKMAVMDDAQYDYQLVFDTAPSMTKKERLVYGESLMTHAMVFTGYDQREGEERPSRWRVENSWGTEGPDKGYYIMTDSWFDEFLYQVVVDKADLSEEVAAILEQEPTVLPAWDPMGSLAASL